MRAHNTVGMPWTRIKIPKYARIYEDKWKFQFRHKLVVTCGRTDKWTKGKYIWSQSCGDMKSEITLSKCFSYLLCVLSYFSLTNISSWARGRRRPKLDQNSSPPYLHLYLWQQLCSVAPPPSDVTTTKQQPPMLERFV